MGDKYRIVLEVSADSFDHVGAAVSIIDSALRDSKEYRAPSPVFRSAELVTNAGSGTA